MCFSDYRISFAAIRYKRPSHQAFNELISYEAGNVNSSIGARLEMWKGTAILISEKPLMGWSKEGYIQAKKEQE